MSWPTDTAILDLAKPFIKLREVYRSEPYLCPAGIPTIFWGTTRYPSGTPVTMRDVGGDRGFAEVCITSSCMKVIDALRHSCTREPTVHQAAALVSFAYNEGVNALLGSTLMRDFERRDDDGVASEFARWNKAHVGGQFVVLDGLTKRREAERALFFTSEGDDVPRLVLPKDAA